MTTTTLASRPAGLGRAVHAEWTKLRTVRSTAWTLAGSAAATVGLGAIIVIGHLDDYRRATPQERAAFDPVAESMVGLFLGLLGFAVAGVLAATAEYSTGTIRTTLTATPRRLRVLAAKAVVVAAATTPAAALTALATFLVTQPIMARESLDASLAQPGVLRAVAGGALFMTGAALMALGLGVTLRHTAGAIATVVVVFFITPLIGELQPDAWAEVTKFLPHTAGNAMLATVAAPGTLSPGAGLAVFGGWIAVTLLAAAAALRCRDA